MALKAMTLGETVSYVSDMDPSKKTRKEPVDANDASKGTVNVEEIGEDASRFSLAALDLFLMAHIYDNASSLTGRQGSAEVGIHTRVNQTNVDAVRFGLRGIDNFADKNGKAVVFKSVKAFVNNREYDVASDEVLNSLGIELVQELATKIKGLSEVSADEAKK